MKNKIMYLPLASILLLSCQATPGDELKVGGCSFNLQPSKEWAIKSSGDQRADISYEYKSAKLTKKANVELTCIDKGINEALQDDFSKSGNEWTFQGGSSDDAVAREIKGPNWHGLQVEYFQSNSCLLTVGSVNDTHSFRLELCDSEDAIKLQFNSINGILRSLNTK